MNDHLGQTWYWYYSEIYESLTQYADDGIEVTPTFKQRAALMASRLATQLEITDRVNSFRERLIRVRAGEQQVHVELSAPDAEKQLEHLADSMGDAAVHISDAAEMLEGIMDRKKPQVARPGPTLPGRREPGRMKP